MFEFDHSSHNQKLGVINGGATVKTQKLQNKISLEIILLSAKHSELHITCTEQS